MPLDHTRHHTRSYIINKVEWRFTYPPHPYDAMPFYHTRSYIINKVEWIPPVMAVQFRPEIKDQFQFKEGQYLYLNCPFIDANEWHPFTISSAQGDLSTGAPRGLELSVAPAGSL